MDIEKEMSMALKGEITPVASGGLRPKIQIPDHVSEINTLLSERGKTHGDFRDHARITQVLKSIIHSERKLDDLSHEQWESLDMIAHKIGRILAGDPDFRDHWDDIAGYAKLVADRCTK